MNNSNNEITDMDQYEMDINENMDENNMENEIIDTKNDEDLEKEYEDDEDEDDIEDDDEDNEDEDNENEDDENDVVDDEDEDEDDEPNQENKTDTNTKVRNQNINQIINSENEIDNEDTESIDTDDSEDDFIEKFDESIRKDHIIQNHPEILQSNFDEVSALTKVVRDENGNVIDPIHKTIPILTKFERTKILGTRAKQLNQGAEPLIPVSDSIVDGYSIAEMELKKQVIPFIVVRPIPGGKKEYWKLQDLEIVDY